ncbi:hypothetical protein FO519_004696 [Halicephalobus sp. NKZ332]|nr:hypothetical protein FO519_004696 [Halicephalobus sp. NKZ332]
MTENIENGKIKYEILENEARMKKIKIFGAWITTIFAAFFIGNVLAKSMYGTIHFVSGDLNHPDLLISMECYVQLPIYILEYKYNAFLLHKISQNRRSSEITIIATEFAKKAEKIENKYNNQISLRDEWLLFNPISVFCIIFLTSVIVCFVMETGIPKKLINYPDKGRFIRLAIYSTFFCIVCEGIARLVQILKTDCSRILMDKDTDFD